MKGKLFALLLVATSGILLPVFSQSSTNRRERDRVEADLDRRMQDMRALDGYARRRSEKDRREMESLTPPELDKRAKERIRQARMLHTLDYEHYKPFLAAEKTGIFRIFPNYDCISLNVVRVDGDCSRFIPESSDFSFRVSAYTSRLFHDIGFERNEIVSDAFFSQGIITDVGDVPIETIDSTHAAMRYLSEFKPDVSPVEAKNTARRFSDGVMSDGFRYASNVAPTVNTTYFLRTINYRLANSVAPLTPDSTFSEIKLKSLEMDKRCDVTVAFRIIRRDDDGGLTIVWKELSRKDAPKLRFGKGEVVGEFK